MDRENIQYWLTTFEQIFNDILEHPNRRVLAFPASLQSLPLSAQKPTESASTEPISPGPDLHSIREALSEISQVPADSISQDVSIFALGLDSIAAIQVAAICRKHGYAVSVADILQGRTHGRIYKSLRGRSHKSLDINDERQEALNADEMKSKALARLHVEDEEVEYALPCLAGRVYHLASWLKSSRATCEAVFT